MKKYFIIFSIILFGGCAATQDVQFKKELELKKAIVKLIKENQKVKQKIIEQDKIIKEHNATLVQQNTEIVNIYNSIKNIETSSDIKPIIKKTKKQKRLELLDKTKVNFNVQVTVPVANMRVYPSADTDIKAKVKRGDILEVVEKTTGQHVWYKVKYLNEYVWIYSKVVEAISNKIKVQSNFNLQFNVVVDVAVANLRLGASVNEAMRFQVVLGAILPVIAISQEDNNWYQVLHKNEKVWVHKSVVQKVHHE